MIIKYLIDRVLVYPKKVQIFNFINVFIVLYEAKNEGKNQNVKTLTVNKKN